MRLVNAAKIDRDVEPANAAFKRREGLALDSGEGRFEIASSQSAEGNVCTASSLLSASTLVEKPSSCRAFSPK